MEDEQIQENEVVGKSALEKHFETFTFDTLDTSKKKLILALEKTLGIISRACNKCGINRQTYYNYLIDEQFKKFVDDIQETAIDFAEGQLLTSIKNGSDTATIFYLKTKGKKRGYIERFETELSGKTEQVIRVRVQGEDEDE